MDCFGNYTFEDAKCRACWLKECCKFSRNKTEHEALAQMKNQGVTVLHFDGETLSEKQLGYNRSLVEFLNENNSASKPAHSN